MSDAETLRRSVEKALAFAHAAVDDPTTYRILEAQSYADEVMPRIRRLKPPAFTLAEARRIVTLVSQLRALLLVLQRRLHPELRTLLS